MLTTAPRAGGEARTFSCEGVRVSFSGLTALEDVDVTLRIGETLGVIGPNGAGKTTLVNVLTGYQPVGAGRVMHGDREITGWPPHRVGRAGVARTFQGVRLFGRLTVAENVEAAGLGGGLGRRAARRLADEVIERFGLSYTRDVEARSLPYGVERRVALARSVAMRPRFLLLDEPAAGLDEAETTALLGQLRELRGWLELGLLVIEHDMTLIMRLCERIQVLDHGRTLAVGTPEEVRTDAAVIEAYLGSARDAAR